MDQGGHWSAEGFDWFLAQRVLPECLRHLQVSWDINEGLEASLARLILADMNDFTSRNKLRLLRICKTLCPPDAAWKLGLVFVSMLSVDPLLYDLLGDSERPRATLADLCSHADSPLARA